MTCTSRTTPEKSALSCGRPWKPHKYQVRAMRWLVQHAAAALFLDPGLGKTSIALGAFKVLKEKGVARRALVVAPLRVCHNVWPAELEKWADFHGLSLSVLHGPRKEERRDDGADVHVVNPEGLPWLLGARDAAAGGGWGSKRSLAGLGYDTLVIDELSKFKHATTQRFKLLRPYLPMFARRWGLTGSPAANGLLDLFGQAYVLDLGNALGRYVTHYRTEFFQPLDPNGWEWGLQPGAEERIYDRLRPLALRMSAEEYLELPELTTTDVVVELPEKAKKVYRQLETLLVAEIDKNVVSVADSSAASNACRQAAAGALYLDETGDARPELVKAAGGRGFVELHTAKLDALEDLVDELQGQPLLVAYEYKHDLARLLARWPGTPYIGGGTSEKKAAFAVKAWNAGGLPLLFGHPAAMGHGLNLQGGCRVCWFSPTWNFELYDQMIRRVWRQGQTEKCSVYRIVAKDTVDEDVLAALGRKDRGQQAFFDALRARRGKEGR